MLAELKYWLSDFLPYSIESWAGLLGYYNLKLWPFSLLLIPLCVAVFWSSSQQPLNKKRIALWLLAICWLWAGVIFIRLNFVTLNWAASYVFFLFILQALFLFCYPLTTRFKRSLNYQKNSVIQYGAMVLALIAFPCIQFFSGYQIHQLGWFALTPDSTALVTLAVLGRMRLLTLSLILIPLLWGILVLAHAWPLGDLAGMFLLPLSVLFLLLHKLNFR